MNVLIAKKMVPSNASGWRDLRSTNIGKLVLVTSVKHEDLPQMCYRITVYRGAMVVYQEMVSRESWIEGMAGARVLPAVASRAEIKLQARDKAYAKPLWKDGAAMNATDADLFRKGWQAFNSGVHRDTVPTPVHWMPRGGRTRTRTPEAWLMGWDKSKSL